jgi:hypothetical protein
MTKKITTAAAVIRGSARNPYKDDASQVAALLRKNCQAPATTIESVT